MGRTTVLKDDVTMRGIDLEDMVLGVCLDWLEEEEGGGEELEVEIELSYGLESRFLTKNPKIKTGTGEEGRGSFPRPVYAWKHLPFGKHSGFSNVLSWVCYASLDVRYFSLFVCLPISYHWIQPPHLNPCKHRYSRS
jgi:hypothetical protein